jgi:hypothetical protein
MRSMQKVKDFENYCRRPKQLKNRCSLWESLLPKTQEFHKERDQCPPNTHHPEVSVGALLLNPTLLNGVRTCQGTRTLAAFMMSLVWCSNLAFSLDSKLHKWPSRFVSWHYMTAGRELKLASCQWTFSSRVSTILLSLTVSLVHVSLQWDSSVYNPSCEISQDVDKLWEMMVFPTL